MTTTLKTMCKRAALVAIAILALAAQNGAQAAQANVAPADDTPAWAAQAN